MKHIPKKLTLKLVLKFDRFFEKILTNKINEGKLILPPNCHVVLFLQNRSHFSDGKYSVTEAKLEITEKIIESNIRASFALSGHIKHLKKKIGAPKLPIRRIWLQTHLKLTHRKFLQVKNWTIWNFDVWNSSKIEFVFNL